MLIREQHYENPFLTVEAGYFIKGISLPFIQEARLEASDAPSCDQRSFSHFQNDQPEGELKERHMRKIKIKSIYDTIYNLLQIDR